MVKTTRKSSMVTLVLGTLEFRMRRIFFQDFLGLDQTPTCYTAFIKYIDFFHTSSRIIETKGLKTRRHCNVKQIGHCVERSVTGSYIKKPRRTGVDIMMA